MTLSLSGRTRKRLAELLWRVPATEPPAIPPGTFIADGLVTQHNSDFVRDRRFERAYRAGEETGSWAGHDVRWRAHVVCWAAMHGRALVGDYVECGVNRGGYARMVAEYVDLAGDGSKRFHLVDTYRGVPDQYLDDRRKAALGDVYSECHADVVRTFAPFPNALVIRGTVPDILGEVIPDQVCFLSIDLNCVEPSIAAAEHFWPRLSHGAVVVLDDYGFDLFYDQKTAFDEFADRHGVQVLSLPTGQGLLVKR